jgi:hypothetical protein
MYVLQKKVANVRGLIQRTDVRAPMAKRQKIVLQDIHRHAPVGVVDKRAPGETGIPPDLNPVVRCSV